MNMTKNKSTSKAKLLAGCSLSAIALMTSLPTIASAAIEEIIVTSQKREQNVMDVPLAITAYDADFMTENSIRNSKDLIKFTPGFAGDTKDSFLEFISVRGISTNDFGAGGDPSVGFFKNGLYQGRTGSAVTNLFDMERAEVLRGPQGFLFGRNAIAGAISFYTKKPDFDGGVSGFLNGGAGQRSLVEMDAALNIPFSDNFAIRIAGTKASEDGYVRNTYIPGSEKLNGYDDGAARITAAARGDSWDLTVIAEYEDHENSGATYRAQNDAGAAFWAAKFGADLLPGPDLYTVSLDNILGSYDRSEVKSFSAEFNFDLGWATLTSLTGYKEHSYQYAEDYDGTAVPLAGWSQDQKGDYFEQELRLVSESDGPLSWYGGVSFFEENLDVTYLNRGEADTVCAYYYYWVNATASTCDEVYATPYYYVSTPVPAYVSGYYGYTGVTGFHDEGNAIRGKYRGWAAYVDVNYQINDKFDIGVGLRYVRNEKDFGINVFPVTSVLGPIYNYGFYTDGFVDRSDSWSGFTPRLIARWRPNDDTLIYGSITNGWKSGGYNTYGIIANGGYDASGLALPGATPDIYKEEKVWSYELGIKGDTANNKLRYDVSAYTYTYTDLQLQYWNFPGYKNTNVGEAKAFGLEGSIQAILGENLDLVLSGSYNSNEITGVESVFPGSNGNSLQMTPAVKASGILKYHTPVGETGEVIASIDFVTQTERWTDLENIVSQKLSGWTDVSVRIGYQDDAGWSVTGYIENLLDEAYYDAGYGGSDIYPQIKYGISRPRTAGVRFHIEFGS
jgi:iron complex outermembrane recepter protein